MGNTGGNDFTGIPNLAVSAEDLGKAVEYIGELESFASSLASRSMGAITRENQTKGAGTPFGDFPDAREQWVTYTTATTTMSDDLSTLLSRLGTLKAGTQAIVRAYADVEARNAASASTIEALLAPSTPPAGSTDPAAQV